MDWFTADQHLDHEMVIEYCKRPWPKIKKMNNGIIARYREVVKPEDTVYFLGDISLRGPENFGYYRRLLTKTLPGRKILILGNHDGLKPFTYVNAGFESVHTSLRIKVPYIYTHVDYIFTRQEQLMNVTAEPYNLPVHT